MSQIIEITRKEEGVYNVTSTLPLPYTYALYWSENNSKHIKKENYIQYIDDAHRSFPFQMPQDKRIYFQLVHEDEVIVCAKRILDVDGMINFRDLGGYPAADGKHIRWGILYRSDYFVKLAAQSYPFVDHLAIKTNIDYRTSQEIKKYPNHGLHPANIMNCDPKAETSEIAARLQYHGEQTEDSHLDEECLDGDAIMMQQQRSFVTDEHSKQAYALALHIMANPDSIPLNQHCRGGKDRTGFGVLLLLGLLGVDEDVILKDYMITKEVRKERNALLWKEFHEKYKDPIVAETCFAMVDIKEEFLKASFDEIHQSYVSIEDYAKAELGISEKEIACMRRHYLE